ncbi:hypothetical protein M0R45_005975 [Rubus argutus]|uniref:Uncharacterized protein n=1 Tax=Rubus argutus TaxID=59490 RepID=A0AAW1YPK4_RUBAR
MKPCSAQPHNPDAVPLCYTTASSTPHVTAAVLPCRAHITSLPPLLLTPPLKAQRARALGPSHHLKSRLLWRAWTDHISPGRRSMPSSPKTRVLLCDTVAALPCCVATSSCPLLQDPQHRTPAPPTTVISSVFNLQAAALQEAHPYRARRCHHQPNSAPPAGTDRKGERN